MVDRVFEILKIFQGQKAVFKKYLKFINWMVWIVKDIDVKELLKKKISQTDQHSIVIFVKNDRLFYWPKLIIKLYPCVMANTKSAIKRIRRISSQTVVNKIRKSRYKNALKKMNSLLDSKNKSEALKFLPKLNSELMKVAKTGIIKKQNASRNVSRITKKINSI